MQQKKWQIGDRLINSRTQIQAIVFGTENGVTIQDSRNTVIVAKQSILEGRGWQLLQTFTN